MVLKNLKGAKIYKNEISGDFILWFDPYYKEFSYKVTTSGARANQAYWKLNVKYDVTFNLNAINTPKSFFASKNVHIVF